MSTTGEPESIRTSACPGFFTLSLNYDYTLDKTAKVIQFSGFWYIYGVCSHHHSPLEDVFLTPERSPTPVSTCPRSSQPPPRRPPTLSPWTGLFWAFVGTASHAVWCLSFQGSPCCGRRSALHALRCCVMGRGMERPRSYKLHSSTDGHLGGLRFLAITNSAAVSAHFQGFLWIYVFISVGYIPRLEKLDHTTPPFGVLSKGFA